MRCGTTRTARVAASLATLWVGGGWLAGASAQTSPEPSPGDTPTEAQPAAPSEGAPDAVPPPSEGTTTDPAEGDPASPPDQDAPPAAPSQPDDQRVDPSEETGAEEPGSEETERHAHPPEPHDPFGDVSRSDGFQLQPSRMTPAEEARLLEELRRYRGPFAQGRLRISVLFGGGTNFQDNYLILGAGLGYFLIDGLEASLGGTAWFLGDPFIGTVTPGLTYVFYQVPKIHPYLGAFYRRYFITGGFDDFDTYGGRGGVNLLLGNDGFVGGGVVYERLFDCQEDVWQNCDQWYPELTVAIVF